MTCSRCKAISQLRISQPSPARQSKSWSCRSNSETYVVGQSELSPVDQIGDGDDDGPDGDDEDGTPDTENGLKVAISVGLVQQAMRRR